MNKRELIGRIAAQTGYPLIEVEKVVDHVVKVTIETLYEGRDVVITGFGKFEMRKRQARRGVNPRTNEPILIPESEYIAFRQSNTMREKIRNR
ncbi:HU family DNA-binding protein [Christensenella intestinihominis]|uniref:HU family DNA-binding protein n=1 Tax=Christensenella intestinihominis TaxID=1851429 RepID=UPI0008300CC9|nr:HU family DNA-binding protein [Christensenella intestinihominis]